MTTPAAPPPPSPLFKDTVPSDKELPDFLSRAAARAHRNKWKDKPPTTSHNSPGFRPSKTQGRMVARLRSLGTPINEIALVLDIEVSLLKFYYKYELDTAKVRTVASVAQTALTMALSGQSEVMTKFWLKTQGGWTEKEQIDHTGIDAAADEARAAREKLAATDED